MADYDWPEASDRSLIGKRLSRLDGPAKVTGRAKYTYDVNRPGMLHGKILRCPHAHARIKSLDTQAAERMPGVAAVRVLQGPGAEIQWALDEVVAVAATSEEIASDALRAVRVEYEVLPHFVTEADRAGAPKSEPGEEEVEGDPHGAMKAAAFKVADTYGLPSISHCCLESHGHACEWTDDRNLTVWASTQAVSGVGSEFSGAMEIPASNVRVLTPYMGGGFGSKFSPDRWGIACAELARSAKAPVKLMLERDAELSVAGDRPSAYARIQVGASKDGTITSWISESWGSGGLGGSGSPPLPYVFEIPNRSHKHTSIATNKASARAWRAPNHPQACFLTLSALEDLAAALRMDPLDFLGKNLSVTGDRSKTYAEELRIGAELMEWKRKWHPRGEAGKGPMKRGLGVSLHTWGGRGHRSNCEVAIWPDGLCEAKLASQDLGTGTRTVIGIVLAETFGVTLDAVKVTIGDSRLPSSGGSGGSTTVGGVSASTRRAAVNARNLLFEKVASRLGVDAKALEAVQGRVQVKGDPSKSLSFKQAAATIGPAPLTATGANPGDGKLTDSGVGGIQMAEVLVDVETGVVRVEKMVAVQDCGLVIDLKTAESQVYGAMIMGISYALSEEKILDPVSGRMLNADMEFYKLPGIGDFGELVVHMMTGPGYDERGVIGLGEPPVISPGAAIGNAVANALGVRVGELPLTPDRVLGALEGRGRVMDAFEYASPKTKEDAVRLLADRPGKAAVLAGGTDLLSLMKDRIESPARLVSLRSIEELRGIRRDAAGLRIGALATLEDLLDDETIARDYGALHHAADGITSPQIRNMGTVGGDLCQRPRCWYYRNGFGLLALRDGASMVPRGDNRYHAVLGNAGPAYFVHASSLAPALIAFRARLTVFGGKGSREIPLESFYRIPSKEGEKEHTLSPDEIVTEILLPPATGLKSATYEVRQKQALDWPLAAASVALEVAGGTIRSARVVLGHVAPIPWRASEAEKALEGVAAGPEAAEKAGEAAIRGAKALGRNAYKIRLARVSVQRAILRALGREV